jgi:UDPglucose 6-dehydrogenase
MKIGIAGLGIIGSALKYALEKINHQVYVHDPKLKNTHLSDLVEMDMIYVCVPTPSMEDGACNTSIVEKVVDELQELQYNGIIVIKSTVAPGTTEKLIERYKNDYICFCPEFIRERCAISDMVENHELLAVGTTNKYVYENVVKSHGKYPKNLRQLSPTEAELLKYYSNCYNTLKVVFANQMFDLAQHLHADYSRIKEAFVCRKTTIDMYLDVNNNFKKASGPCLPKDLAAIRALIEQNNLNIPLFKNIETINNSYIPTVWEGMRKTE